MIDESPRPAWLHCDWSLSQFGAQRSRQIARYVEFVQQGMAAPSVWLGLKGPAFLGTDAFAEAMQRRLQPTGLHQITEIPRLQRRALAKALSYYRETFDDRNLGMAAAYATVSRAVTGTGVI